MYRVNDKKSNTNKYLKSIFKKLKAITLKHIIRFTEKEIYSVVIFSLMV